MEGKCYFFNHFLSETYYDSIFFTIFALETVPVVWRGIIYKYIKRLLRAMFLAS